MKEKVLIDTGYWIALYDQRDQNHTAAKDILKSLFQNYQACISDFILFETLTYLNCSIKRHDLALKFLTKSESPGISFFIIDEPLKLNALD